MKQPFKIGQQIFGKQNGHRATVTGYTKRGFKYRYDETHLLGVRLGVLKKGTHGECFELGFDGWEKWEGNNKISSLVVFHMPPQFLEQNKLVPMSLERTPAQKLKDSLIVHSYRLPCSDPISQIEIQERHQPDGPSLWCVKQFGSVLNKKGKWEYEPIPSSRTDAFLNRCRFASVDEAVAVLAKVIV